MPSHVDIIASVRLLPFDGNLSAASVHQKLSEKIGNNTDSRLIAESEQEANVRFYSLRSGPAQEVRVTLERVLSEWRSEGLIWNWEVFFELEPDPKYRPKPKRNDDDDYYVKR